tara:strand:- start:168 stop:494 length:327 start_codon:yes stop_codon:yes gene_type:complete
MTPDKVATEKETQLCDYEMIVVISPEIGDEKFEATIENISSFITRMGGVISGVERWGKKNLAYPIKHHVDGSYVLTRFQMKPTSGKELEASLQISGDVLRHLLIKLDS